MSSYNLLKGHNIRLKGSPKKNVVEIPLSTHIAIHPSQYRGMKPKLLVKKGDNVKVGSPIFYDKTKESVKVVSSASGTVEDIVFGKRRIVEKVLIKVDGDESESLSIEREKGFKDFLLTSGLWSYLRQRPFSKVPDPDIKPRAIFLSLHQTNPFSLDLEHVLKDSKKEISKGIELISSLTDGNVFLTLKKGSDFLNDLDIDSRINVNYFSGPHPSGNIGVHIHHLEPIANKDDLVYYLSLQDLLSMVRTYNTGKYHFDKIVSCGGTGLDQPSYYKIRRGTLIRDIVGDIDSTRYRIISGDVLSGRTTSLEHSLSSFDEILSVIPEIREREFVGWALPGLKKYSLSNTFISSALGLQESDLETGLNGSIRAIIPFGRWEKVLPMDIYPDFLVKSILAKDIDQMEKLGIYECDPEDFALCAFSCQSKIEVSSIIQSGLDFVELEG